MSADSSHLVPLGGTSWSVWRECVLRSAGFAAAQVLSLCDRRLAEVADRPVRPGEDELEREWGPARARLTAAVRAFAREPRFREAVAWQNLGVLRLCVDKVAAERPAKPSDQRQRELAIASYVQRYTVKNDTIGFFGPVCWTRWTAQGPALDVRPGDSLLAERTVYFESWAIDAVALALSSDPDILPWLTPRVAAASVLEGDSLRMPNASRVQLTAAQLRLLRRCDGVRTVREVAAELPLEEALAELDALRARGLVELDLTGPVEARPELTLRRKLLELGDRRARDRALGALDQLVAARDMVATAAGDADKLATALEGLNQAFERITARAASRRHGQTYAGRSLVYEDTVRDADVSLGRPLLDAISQPLALLLESARWLVGQAADSYRRRFLELYERQRRRGGHQDVPLAAIAGAATRDLAFSWGEPPARVAALTGELQRRWARILQVPQGAREHTVSAAAIADLVARQFPGRPPEWSSAVHHSPDLMIAASDPEAVNRGELSVVLGELHVAANTLDSRLWVEQHERPQRLLAADEADHGGRRLFPVPAKESPLVNSRTYPSALLSPRYTYWCMHSGTAGAPAEIRPAAELTVRRRGDRLIVRSQRDGQEFDLLEALGEYLSAAVMNCFSILPPAAHRPRVSIDRLVVVRESWSFRASEVAWAFVKDERERFRQARSWRAAEGLPERAFYRVPVEDKPVFVDFASIAFVNLVGKAVRRSAGHDRAATVTLTEMLPDLRHTWLRDAGGAGYTAELRLVAVDPAATSRQERR